MNSQLLASPGQSVDTPPGRSPRSLRHNAKQGRFAAQHRRRMFRADMLTVALWASLAAALSLWLADGGASSVGNPTQAVTAVGILAGLAGMDLVIVMLLLAARLPFVDGAVGHDRALEFHRKLGKPALYLLLAHGLLLATGYGMAEGLNPVSEAVSLWVLVPDMWLAFVSMALFIAVVVTSLVAVRRRFPYEFWYVVHLLTYLAVATALPHQFSVGGLFAEGTWQRWYWLLLCIATGSALAWYRIARPVLATYRHQLTVRRVVRVSADVVSIEMAGLRLNELSGSGGRFFVWRFLAPGMWWQAHPFSLSAEPQVGTSSRQPTLRITVRNLGAGSARLASLKPGTKVAIEGPYGVFSTAARSRDRVVMIGAGIGITPLRALLESTPFAPGQATVLLRGSSAEELFLGDEILELCKRRGATLFHLTGRRSPDGRSTWLPASAGTARLPDFVPDIADADVYVCGPAAWAGQVLAEAKSSGVREEQLHYERFDW
ncbi:ferredoxin reductase family protein [Arthrobacter bambusae]|uniref:ferredoxin reductase family protein n=1 Tax=Arthrobacter bambusae TaxID=1338426 RepID=UPI0027880B1C|nr:ferredoxin reductase family protein [Arthrobacter bambusae]MDQ0032237.1 putative ferric reductase [Arthrobacter bambusae]MDQ0100354.1 putative ferric reductase [Arthrobacter bambusae]